MCDPRIRIAALEARYWPPSSGGRASSYWSAPGPLRSGPFAFTSGTGSAWFPQKKRIDCSVRIGRFLSDNGRLLSSCVCRRAIELTAEPDVPFTGRKAKLRSRKLKSSLRHIEVDLSKVVSVRSVKTERRSKELLSDPNIDESKDERRL